MKPWDDIGNPETEDSYSVRLADPMHNFDFFWGKNITGQYVFRFFGDFDSSSNLCIYHATCGIQFWHPYAL